MNSRLAFLLKKSFHQGWIFSASSVRSNVNYGFGKSAGCALQGHTLLKRCYTLNFLKNVLLRKLVFGIISENNVQSVHCRLATLLKKTPWEFLKLWQSIIFRKIVICVEELNYMKDYMKAKITKIACKFAKFAKKWLRLKKFCGNYQKKEKPMSMPSFPCFSKVYLTESVLAKTWHYV